MRAGNNQQNNTSNSGERNNAKTKTQHNDKINKSTAATGPQYSVVAEATTTIFRNRFQNTVK